MNNEFIFTDITKNDDQHISIIEMKKYIESGVFSNTEHLDRCYQCQNELSEVFKDLCVIKEINRISLLDKIQIEISRLKEGIGIIGDVGFFQYEPLPGLRGETEKDKLLNFTNLVYTDDDFVKIKVEKPGAKIQIQISPLGKFKKIKNFFLYNNSKLIESIALKSRQSGTFQNISPGSIQIKNNENSIFQLTMHETE
jgi:hypothetical protein